MLLSLVFSSALASEPDAAKLAELEHTFNDQIVESRLWFWGWLSVFVTASGVQAGLAIAGANTGNTALRNAGIVNSVHAGLGGILHAAFPLTSAFSDVDFAHSNLQGSEKLAWARQRLQRDAAAAQFGRGWLAHVGGAALSTASGLILWLAFRQPLDALFAFLSSLAVAEIRIWTQPTHVIANAARLSAVALPGGMALAVAW